MKGNCTGSITMNAIQILNDLSFQYKRKLYPNVPDNCLVRVTYSDNTANGLTKCILDFLRFSGWQAERISNMGKLTDTRKSYQDGLGRNRTIGAIEWRKGNGTNGTADISATINGQSVKIEVKIGSDRQSKAQRDYQNAIQKAGGKYIVAKTFEGFYNWYNQNVTP